MTCKKCGYELMGSWNNCPVCGVPVTGASTLETSSGQENQDRPKSNGKEKLYIRGFLSSLVLWFLLGLVSDAANLKDAAPLPAVLSVMSTLCFISAIITIVTGFIKCPGSRAIKVLLWVFITILAAYILSMLFLMIMCGGLVRSSIEVCGSACTSCG